MKSTMRAKKTTTPVTNSSNRPLWRRGSVVPVLFLAIFALGFFALLPPAQAAVPPPDGCYPNYTTAEGCKALYNLTTGLGNTGIGWYPLFSTTAGNFNTGVGAGALVLNNANNNTATGAGALLLNITGTNNTANGVDALVFNDTGEENTATGAFALNSNTEGDFNTANGAWALYFNTTGERNTAMGDSALYSNSTGNRNTAIGNPALLANTTGADNTATGFDALRNNTSGHENTANGVRALSGNTFGNGNTAYGRQALFSNTFGGGNAACGNDALASNTSGSANTAVGGGAGALLTTGDGNVCIGANVYGIAGESNTTRIRNIYASVANGRAVYVNSDDKIGTLASSRRFKEEIKPMDNASEALFALKPVTFRYKKQIDPMQALSFGLIAEEVAKINPELITRDQNGKPETVRYEAINAMLLNEFLKEHRKVQELEAKVARQQNDSEASGTKQREQIQALTARLDQQAAELQKGSAKIEVSKPTPQLAMRSN